MSEQNQQAYDEAMNELDQLQKSENESIETELDELTKALEAEIAGEEELAKSDKEEDDDEDNDDEDDKPFGKSDDSDFDDELVKASEAYADLTKSVEEGIGGIYAELDAMKKSMAALMNLNIKQAKVIAEMVKSQKADTETIAKSLESVGAKPTMPNSAKIGVGGTTEAPMTKSHSEVHDALLKAIQEGKVQAHYLSMYGTYRSVDVLPEEVKQAIGC